MNNLFKYKYIIAFFFGFLIFALFGVVRLQSSLTASYAFALAIILCTLLSAMFAAIWPHAPWRWGFLVSSSFWLFLSLVFVSYLINGQYEWSPVIEAVTIVSVTCIGALLGWWISKRAQKGTPVQ